jgi:formylglycine-generating enzyme required for sulfatase activity
MRMALCLLPAQGFFLACALVCSLAAGESERGLRPLSLRDATGTEVAAFSSSLALVIGCSAYRNGWSPLEGVVADVAAVASALEEGGFRVTRLLDPDAAQLQQALRAFVVGPGGSADNRVLIYFAGHGATQPLDDGRKMGYLVPVDAPRPDRDLALFRRSALDMQEVDTMARRIAARHALFVFDACFAGTLFAMRSGPAAPPAITARIARPVRLMITSGSAEQSVPDQSAFRRYFVRGIAGEADLNRDNWVTGSELGEFLLDKTAGESRGQQTPQIGKVRDPDLDQGDFVFAVPGDAVPAALPEALRPAPAAPARPAVEKPAWAAIAGVDARGGWAELRFADAVQILRLVPAGTFAQGSPDGPADERPQRQVAMSRFWLGDSEVTQALWKAVMGTNPSAFSDDPLRPVEQVSVGDCRSFCDRLNGMIPGLEVGLPSEAQWEYACRAMAETAFAGEAESLAWHDGNTPKKTMPIKRKQPNVWGFYDMHGNVWEWTDDWYAPYPATARLDPAGPPEGDVQVIRGGAWNAPLVKARSAQRGWSTPTARRSGVGFRLRIPASP